MWIIFQEWLFHRGPRSIFDLGITYGKPKRDLWISFYPQVGDPSSTSYPQVIHKLSTKSEARGFHLSSRA